MMRPLRTHGCVRYLFAALSLLAFGAAGRAAITHARPRPNAEARRGLAHEAGPIARSIPPGARVAETSDELRALLADPNGPAEIWLRARSYRGDFSVTRKLALRGELGASLDGGGQGTVLLIEADGASVENLVIRNSGRRSTTEDAGIKAKGARIAIRDVRVESTLFGISLGPCPHCELSGASVQGDPDELELKGDGVKLWESNDATVRGCVVDRVRDVVVWYSRRVLLEGNRVTRSRYGSHFMYAQDSVVRDSRIENNVVGIFVMYSSGLRVENNVLAGARGAAGIGIGFKESDGVQITGNAIVANTTGTYLDETPRSEHASAHIAANLFALNDVAVRFHGIEGGLSFLRNDFRQNAVLADVEGGGDARGVEFRRNHFSDYVGYDLDGDGVGDVAYQQKRLATEWTDSHPALALFTGTAAMGLLEAVANAMPVFASRILLEDREPALRFDRDIAP